MPLEAQNLELGPYQLTSLIYVALLPETASWKRIIVACITPAVIPVCILMVGVAFFHPEGTAWRDGPPIPLSPRRMNDNGGATPGYW